jgi:hypothetical protein
MAYAAAAVLLALTAVAWFSAGPVPQDPRYHDYADRRVVLGIPYGWNVVSNLALVAAGAAGLGYLARLGRRGRDGILVHYGVLFAGALLSGLGSAYYHLAPTNDTLVWDRLAISVGMAGFFSAAVAELVGRRLAGVLLPVWLLAGLGSVGYWIMSEQAGAGDLRAYAVVQFLPVPLLAWMLWAFPRPRRYTPYVLAAIAWYALAKLFELLDGELFALAGVSGHTLKHLAAAAAPACLLPMLRARYDLSGSHSMERQS